MLEVVVVNPGVVLVFGLVWLALGIFVVVDANRYPDWAFAQTGASKTVWQVVPIVLAVFCGLGTLVMAIIWFAAKKPAVERALSAGGYGYGYPPPPPPQGGWAPSPPHGAPPSWAPPPPSPQSPQPQPPQPAPPPPAPPPPQDQPPSPPPPTWGAPPPQQ